MTEEGRVGPSGGARAIKDFPPRCMSRTGCQREWRVHIPDPSTSCHCLPSPPRLPPAGLLAGNGEDSLPVRCRVPGPRPGVGGRGRQWGIPPLGARDPWPLLPSWLGVAGHLPVLTTTASPAPPWAPVVFPKMHTSPFQAGMWGRWAWPSCAFTLLVK